MRTRKPVARTENLVVEEIGDEVLIYDQRIDEAHCLSVSAGQVWRACDGTMDAKELAAKLVLDADTVTRALQELEECSLLDVLPSSRITRREATAKMAKVGGAAAAAPLIYSILAPTPALATSQNTCINLTQCFGNGSGCATCYQAGCACCGSGTSGGSKLCTQDCSPCFCTAQIIHDHCGGTGTSSTCTSGPNHLPTTC